MKISLETIQKLNPFGILVSPSKIETLVIPSALIYSSCLNKITAIIPNKTDITMYEITNGIELNRYPIIYAKFAVITITPFFSFSFIDPILDPSKIKIPI
jgi:hypothetical protein